MKARENVRILVASAQAGSPKALEYLVNDFSPLIDSMTQKRSFNRAKRERGGSVRRVAVSFNMPLNRDDLQDLRQHLTLTFIQRVRQYNWTRKFASYIYDSLGWATIGWWKRHSRHRARHTHYSEDAFDGSDYDHESLEEPYCDDVSGTLCQNDSVLSLLKAPADMIVNNAETSMAIDKILSVIRQQPRDIQMFAILYYFYGFNQIPIANAFGFKSNCAVAERLKLVQEALFSDPDIRKILNRQTESSGEI